ncbi:MAG: hypothetical protein IJV76_02445, partial [Clostridia bacterium]|nr:hypothetical protein [Clostridia bacterium]
MKKLTAVNIIHDTAPEINPLTNLFCNFITEVHLFLLYNRVKQRKGADSFEIEYKEMAPSGAVHPWRCA